MGIVRNSRRLAALLVSVLAAAGLTTACGSEESSGSPPLRLGRVPALSWTPWASVPDELAPSGLKAELVPFKSSNDVLVALSSGAFDMGTAGYNNVASILATQQLKAKFVAGTSANGSVFVARKGSGIADWRGLAGRKIGTVRGSTQYVNLVTGMAARGMDLNRDSSFVNIQTFNELNLALQRGDIDAMVTFPPNSGIALEGGYGEIVQTIQAQLYDGSFFVASGVLASDALVQNRPADVQKVIDTYVAQGTKLDGDKGLRASTFQKYATASGRPELMTEALRAKHVLCYPNLDVPQIRQVPATLAKLGEIPRDTSADLVDRLDFTFLSKATGKPAEQLGRG
jgi:ABC-type nitrate/sulfonate/bicarbonate transport system substrate-binding protein